MIVANKKIVLGSKSPRRKDLLEGAGIEFSIRTKDTDESYPDTLPLFEVPVYIATNKANALKTELANDELLICADTVVIIENSILGKPDSEQDANSMLKLLSGKTHNVVTGVVITSKEKTTSFSVTTEVTFKQLSSEEISYYITTFQPFDKAGSYGIQEWIGYIGISSIKGSFFNVMGLPIYEVYEALKKF